jgi:ubiquinone/menaquinone biosynthesis C-methylase UbiE/uncharacterized Rossmann fold enzyme
MTKTLDASKPQNVVYCIPLWLRDEQILANTKRVKGRIRAREPHDDAIAIVCYGPSLNDTWEQIKKFKYVMSCSGAHKFLLERGIVPTWHVEVDPREHKLELLGEPHKSVEYLIASTCHPKVFERLDGFNVKLWHVFDPSEDAMRVLPYGEWALTGGCSAGLRTLTIARFLGFKRQHIFGMDGCEGPSGKHAAAHPLQPKDHSICNYDGVDYRTTQSMLETARQTWHELDQMHDVQATFYGQGLVQAMSKNYKRNPLAVQKTKLIAFNKPETISDEYRDLNRQLHETNLAYGVGGAKHANTVKKLVDKCKCASVLDYGCGKGHLAKELPFPIWEYDPAIPLKSASPRPADLVVCTDVLEHVEPDHIAFVLDDLRRCVKKIGFFTIHTGPARKTLPDGRNTHILQRDEKWWRQKLKKYFTVGSIQAAGPELYVVVSPKKKEMQNVIESGRPDQEDRGVESVGIEDPRQGGESQCDA